MPLRRLQVRRRRRRLGIGRATSAAPRKVAPLHDTKLDALEELVEELCGAPLLVAYEFNHDLERLQKRFPAAPYIGAGVSSKHL
jgi:hypothetical protein